MFWGRTSRILGMVLLFVVVAAFYAYLEADLVGVPSNLYGEALSRDEHSIKGAVVEKVALYPQKMARSHERIMRKALFVKRKKAIGTVLISHGFMCTKEDISFLRSLFPEYNSMVFDMRAHGENAEGQYCTLGRDEALDVATAARYLRNREDLRGQKLLLYGFSMGAVAAIEAQANDSTLFDGMILDCPFESSENVIKRGLSNMKLSLFGYEISIPGKTLMEKYIFHPYVQSFIKSMLKAFGKMDTKDIKAFVYPVNPAKSIARVSVPLYLIGCKKDDKVSIAGLKRIYSNAGSKYKKLWVSNGRQHFDSYFYNPELYARRVAKFSHRLFSGKLNCAEKQKIIEDKDPASLAVHINAGRFTEIKKKEK